MTQFQPFSSCIQGFWFFICNKTKHHDQVKKLIDKITISIPGIIMAQKQSAIMQHAS